MMLTKLEKHWNELNEMILINKQDLVLGAAVCALAGMLAGILLSPRKTMRICTNHYAAGSDPEAQEAECPED